MAISGLEELLRGIKDSRSSAGIYSRGANIYNASSNSARNGFKPYYRAAKRRLRGEQARLRNVNNLNRRRINEDYRDYSKNLQKSRQEALNQYKYNMADQGLIHSGINLSGQQKIGRNYISTRDELSKGRARSLEDLSNMLTLQKTALQNQREALELERSRYAQQQQLEEALASSEQKALEKYLAGRQATRDNSGRISYSRQLSTEGADLSPEIRRALIRRFREEKRSEEPSEYRFDV